MKNKVLFTWSSGKDSALALYELRKDPNYEVIALLTTVTQDYDRVSMHGVRRVLLEQQAASMGIPLDILYINNNTSSEEYELKMKDKLSGYLRQGVTTVAFGDIFLEDLRKSRESNLAKVGMQALFPIWKRDTTELSQTLIKLGFKAVTTCIDSQVLDKSFAGRTYDEQFLRDLPPAVDPCGENGEFHSFAFAGPIFHKEVSFTKGELVLRDNRFCFCDLCSPFKL